jgi:hypothetical protein
VSYSEPFVGCVAIVFAFAAAAVSVGPWTAPYQLRSIAVVRRRFGMPAARLVWFAVAVTSLTSGIAILAGVRPSYATPAQRTQLER